MSSGISDLKLTDNSSKVIKAAEDQIKNALIILGNEAEGNAKQKLTDNHSVVTGRLRASIAHTIDVPGKCVYIGTNVEYAPYVEFGTGKNAEEGAGGNQTITGHKPKPYLRPAISDHVNDYKEIIKKELSR